MRLIALVFKKPVIFKKYIFLRTIYIESFANVENMEARKKCAYYCKKLTTISWSVRFAPIPTSAAFNSLTVNSPFPEVSKESNFSDHIFLVSSTFDIFWGREEESGLWTEIDAIPFTVCERSDDLVDKRARIVKPTCRLLQGCEWETWAKWIHLGRVRYQECQPWMSSD